MARPNGGSMESVEKQRTRIVSMSYKYLLDNFSKFTAQNKLKVALELVKKDMPNKLEGNPDAPVLVMPTVKINGKPHEAKIGD